MTCKRNGRQRFLPTLTTLAVLRVVEARRTVAALDEVAVREGMVFLLCETVIETVNRSRSTALISPNVGNRAVRNALALHAQIAQGIRLERHNWNKGGGRGPPSDEQ